MFSYPNGTRYRKGPNYQQLPPNRALKVYSPYQRDDTMRLDGNYGSEPDYIRSSFRKIRTGPANVAHDEWVGKIQSYSSEVTEEDFEQPRMLWKIFKGRGEDKNFIHKLSGHMNKALREVQKEAVKVWAKIGDEIARRLQEALDKIDNDVDPQKAPPTQVALKQNKQ